MDVYCKASLRAGGASHPSRTFAESLEVMITPSRVHDDSCNFYEHQFHEFTTNISPESRSPPRLFPRTPPDQAMAVSRGSCPGRVLWRPHMPHPMLSTPSHAISCTPIPPWSSSKCRNTPSTNQLHVFAFQVGRSVWLNKDYCLNTSSKFFRQGGNAWNLFDFDEQSAAFFC